MVVVNSTPGVPWPLQGRDRDDRQSRGVKPGMSAMWLSAPLREAWRTMAPAADDPHHPLPPLLLGLTVVTGLVDAFSYLVLGHVFVANMTATSSSSGLPWPAPAASPLPPHWL